MTLKDLNKLIDESGLSDSELSRLSGVSKPTISRIRNNPKYDPSISIVEKIMRVIKK